MQNVSEKGLENNYFRKRGVRIFTLASALVTAVLFSLALALDFEPESCLFKNGSVLAVIAQAAAYVLGAASVVLSFVLVPKEPVEEGLLPNENEYFDYYTLDCQFVKILRICVAVLLITQGAVRTVVVITGSEKAAIPMPLMAVLLISVFPLAMYFIPELTDKIKLNGRTHVIFGTVGLVWFFLNVVNSYLVKDYPLSSEYRLMEQVCYVVMLLAITYEIRYRLDGTKLRARLATLSLATVIGFGFGFGRVVMLVCGKTVSFSDVCSVFSLFALSLYFGARIFFYEEN